MTGLRSPGLPEEAIRDRARRGAAAAFPPLDQYGSTVYGGSMRAHIDALDAMRLVPPAFVPQRLEKLIEVGREPRADDVDLTTTVGGLTASFPLYVSAFGSTQVAGQDLGVAAARQAGQLGIPVVIGENIVPVNGYGRSDEQGQRSLLRRVSAYLESSCGDVGGVVVQQSTEDADAEVWNCVYSDPAMEPLLATGRLAFELKVGQGAKPGLGGMTVLDRSTGRRLVEQFAIDELYGADVDLVLRSGSPGTFTPEILHHQIRLMRNNFPRSRVWAKLPPARDVAAAAAIAWSAGADSVTIDGGEGGTGWAPMSFLDHVGLPLAECLLRIADRSGCLLASGRMWEGSRATKALALGATAVGLGRAALLAVAEDPDNGLVRLVDCLAAELRMLISALGVYSPGALGREDLWLPGEPRLAPAAECLVDGPAS